MTSRYSRSFFLEALFGPYYRGHKGFILGKTVDTRTGESTTRYFADVPALAREQWADDIDVLFGICPRDRMGRDADRIHHVVALWAELEVDPHPRGSDSPASMGAKQVADAIKAFPFTPSVLVGSGSGVQLYWLLREPCEVNDARWVLDVLEGIAKRLGSGRRPSLTDVLRLPDTFRNDIPGKHSLCEVRLMDSSTRYDLDHFLLLFGASTQWASLNERVPASPFVDIRAFRKAQMPSTFEETVTLVPDYTAGAELEEDAHTELTMEVVHAVGEDLFADETLSAEDGEPHGQGLFQRSDSRFMIEGLEEEPVTVELTADLLGADVDPDVDATVDQLLCGPNGLILGDLTSGALKAPGSPGPATAHHMPDLDSEPLSRSPRPGVAQPPSSGDRVQAPEASRDFSDTHTATGPGEEISDGSGAADPRGERETAHERPLGPDRVAPPAVVAAVIEQGDSQAVMAPVVPPPERVGLFGRAGGLLRGLLGSKPRVTSARSAENSAPTVERIPVDRETPATSDRQEPSSQVMERRVNPAAVTLVCGETLCRLFPEGAALPSAVTARIRPGMAFRGQPLDLFHGNRKVGSIILPDMWLATPEGGHLELTAKHDGDYLEVGVRETASDQRQLLRVPLPTWDEVEIAVESPARVSTDEGLSATVHLRAVPPGQPAAKASAMCATVRRGSPLALRLSVPGLPRAGPLRESVWVGKSASVDLAVEAFEGPEPTGRRGMVTAILDTVPLGQIEFELESSPNAGYRAITGVTAHPFRVFFVLSAIEDRTEVARRLGGLALMGRKILPHGLDLEPHGHGASSYLHKLVDSSDAVLLFWSENAKGSALVVDTFEYALETKGAQRLIPVLLHNAPTTRSDTGLGEVPYGPDWVRTL
ncbi:MAG: hypothetical protein AB1646_18925 [Thermodesulfobacteriota bacterium]